MDYKHTQIGYLIIVVLFFISLINVVVLSQTGVQLSILATMFFVIFILASFTTLQVSINEKYLSLKFGYGIFSKKFKINEIKSAKRVRNHWYFGWGIRFWICPRTWIYNVSGFDAVEIILKNGKRYRIGTDEPKKLEQALLKSIK